MLSYVLHMPLDKSYALGECFLAQKVNKAEEGEGFKTFSYGITADGETRINGCVTLHVSSDMLAGGTGCKEWEAGFILGEVILNNSTILKGKDLLAL